MISDFEGRIWEERVLERREFCLAWSFTSTKKCSATQNPVQVPGAPRVESSTVSFSIPLHVTNRGDLDGGNSGARYA